MADSTVSALTGASTLDGTELYYGVQGGADKKVTGAQIKTLAQTGLGALAQKSQASLTTDVTGVLPVANGGTGTASPGIVPGTNVTVTGTWPNQTVNSTGGGSFSGGAIAAPIQITGGTQTGASNPVIDSTQTWNNAATAFTGWKLNVTDTASNGPCKLIDLQVGGSSKFSIDKYSGLTVDAIATFAQSLSSIGLKLAASCPLSWSANSTPAFTNDAGLSRNAAGVVEVNNGTAGTYRKLITGGLARGFVAKTAAYTATTFDDVISCDATGGAFTITLPTAVGVSGQLYTIKKVDSSANAITVATTSSQTIDGATTSSLPTQWNSLRLISNGANWLVI